MRGQAGPTVDFQPVSVEFVKHSGYPSYVKSDGTGCDTVQDFARSARLQLRFSHVGEPEDVDRRVGKLLERR